MAVPHPMTVEAFAMSVQTTYPGVYIVEQTSVSHVIAGVSTSVTAFVGAARQGPSDEPTAINSYADFARQFGDPGAVTLAPSIAAAAPVSQGLIKNQGPAIAIATISSAKESR